MPLTIINRAQPNQAPVIVIRLRRRSITNFRQAYFSEAGDVAARYRIDFDRVLRHLWNVRRSAPGFTLKNVQYIDDLVHVIACIDGLALAWADLAEEHERTLVRSCRGSHDEVSAMMLVRRLFVGLRAGRHGGNENAMSCYTGARPLRAWLTDRLNAIRTREALVQFHQQRTAAEQSRGRLRAGEKTIGASTMAAAGPILLFPEMSDEMRIRLPLAANE